MTLFMVFGGIHGTPRLTPHAPGWLPGGAVINYGDATFGGTTQLVVTWLIHITGSAMAPAWYVIGATAIGQVALMLMPESAPACLPAAPARLATADASA